MTDYDYSASPASATTVTGFFDSRTEAEAAAVRLRAVHAGLQVQITEGADADGASGQMADDNRGFFDKIADFFFPEDDRHTYAEGLSRGGYLLVVNNVSPATLDAVADELEDAGAIDIDERAESWRADGWTGQAHADTGHWSETSRASFGTASGGLGDGAATSALSAEGGASSDGSVPVVEERLRVGKRDVSHGRVRIRSYIVEEPVTETVRLESERVDIERRPVDQPVTGAATDLFRERTIEAEETGEEAIVAKEARVVEEIGLRRTRESHEETVSDTVRHTEVEIGDDRGAGAGTGATSGRSGMTEYEAESGLPEDDEAAIARRARRDGGL